MPMSSFMFVALHMILVVRIYNMWCTQMWSMATYWEEIMWAIADRITLWLDLTTSASNLMKRSCLYAWRVCDCVCNSMWLVTAAGHFHHVDLVTRVSSFIRTASLTPAAVTHAVHTRTAVHVGRPPSHQLYQSLSSQSEVLPCTVITSINVVAVWFPLTPLSWHLRLCVFVPFYKTVDNLKFFTIPVRRKKPWLSNGAKSSFCEFLSVTTFSY